jgi:hypothetical protein
MQIPRFGVKFLLIAIAVVSLWLSTFAFYNGANEVRATIILFGLLAAGLAAAYIRGERQAFWTISVPTFEWLTAVIVPEPAQGGIPLAQQNLIFAGRMSVTLLLQLVFAVAAGLMAVSIHRWSRTGLKG